MKTLLGTLFLAATLIQSSPARADVVPQGLSVTLAAGSVCSTLNYDFGVYGENLTTEHVLVTDRLDATLLDSTFTTPPQSVQGVVTRSISVPQAASRTNGLLGLQYSMQGQSALLGQATFFSVIDCSNGKQLFSCAGSKNDCPVRLSDYLPKAGYSSFSSGDLISGQAIEFNHLIYGSGDGSFAGIDILNIGILGLQVKSVRIDGPDAALFSLDTGLPEGESIDQRILGKNDSAWIGLEFIGNKKAGSFNADLIIVTTDPLNPTVHFPLVASAETRQDLSIDLKNVKLKKTGANGIISGTVVIRNLGSKTSKAGAEIGVALYDSDTLREQCDSYYSDTECNFKSIYQLTLKKVRLPKIKSGKKITLKFSSKPLSLAKHRITSRDQVSATVKAGTSEISVYNDSALSLLK